jgi:hypothetical protein
VLFIEKAAGAEFAKRSTVRGRMPRAHLENGAAFELDAHHSVRADVHVIGGNDGDNDNRVMVHAVDEIADAQRRNWAIAERRADGRIRCGAARTASIEPLPDAVLASDP